MAKRMKSVQTEASGEQKLVGGQVAQPVAARDRNRRQPQSARESNRAVIEDADRARAGPPDGGGRQ